MTSIIIPAHDEASVIHKTLDCLTEGAQETDWQKDYEIIVVCNGCTDNTADICRTYSGVKVVESEIGNKAHAMNLGDEHAAGFPRIYLDADIVTDRASMVAVADVLKNGEADLAAPSFQIDLDGCTLAVRSFYKVWLELPYFKEQLIGAGVYALSEQGRKAFGEFPDLFSEDEYIRLLFPKERRQVVKEAWFRFRPPTNLGALLKIRSRHQRGNYQLQKLYPDLWKRKEPTSGVLGTLARRPDLWPWVVPYSTVVLITRANGYYQLRNLSKMKWDKDTSSRAPVN